MSKTHKTFSLLKYVALVSLVAVSLVVVFEQYDEVRRIEENEFKAVNKSLMKANERMGMYFKVLRSQVALSSFREIDLIREIFRHPEDLDIAEELARRVTAQLPGSFAVTVTNMNGVPLITDFEGLLGGVCLRGIKTFTGDTHESLIQLHPHPVSTHFDIMVKIDDHRYGYQGVFFVSFELDRIVEILNESNLPGHQLVLLLDTEDKDDPQHNIIEVTQQGDRTVLGDDIWLTDEELGSLMGSSDIEGTMWKLVDLPDEGLLAKKLNFAISKLIGYIALILLMLSTIIYFLKKEARLKSELKAANIGLEEQVRQRTLNLVSANERSSTIIEHASDAIISIDEEQKIRLFNASAEKMFGYTQKEIIGQPLSVLLPKKDRKAHVQHVHAFADMKESSRAMNNRREIRCLHKDGVIFPAIAAICKIDDNGKTLFTAFVHDLSERKEKEQQMMDLAMSDELTGLANRRYFDTELERAIANARRLKNKVGILLIDMDHFKSVNDTHGHLIGDKLLQAVAKKLSGCLRETDIIGRIGGDEFAAIVTGLNNTDELYVIARKLNKRSAGIARIDNNPVNSTISIGMSVFPDHAETKQALLACADKALYAAKEKGRNTCAMYGRDG